MKTTRERETGFADRKQLAPASKSLAMATKLFAMASYDRSSREKLNFHPKTPTTTSHDNNNNNQL